MKCSNCNQVVPEDSKYCPFCGTKIESFIRESECVQPPKDVQQSDLDNNSVQNAADGGSEKKKKAFLPIVIAAVVLLAVLSVFIIINSTSMQPAANPAPSQQATAPTAKKAGTVFIDSVSGVSFTLPEGWTEDNTDVSDDTYSTKFVAEDQLAIIKFTRSDVWSGMSAASRNQYSRSDLDNTYWKTVVLDDAEREKIKMVTFNGKEYFWWDESNSNDDYSSDGLKSARAVIMEDGYGLIFIYVGVSGSPHFNEFKKIIYSADYSGLK